MDQPEQFRPYAGPPSLALDTLIHLIIKGQPGRAAKEFLVRNPTLSEKFAAMVYFCSIISDSELKLSLEKSLSLMCNDQYIALVEHDPLVEALALVQTVKAETKCTKEFLRRTLGSSSKSDVQAYITLGNCKEAQAILDSNAGRFGIRTEACLRARILALQGDSAKAIELWSTACQSDPCTLLDLLYCAMRTGRRKFVRQQVANLFGVPMSFVRRHTLTARLEWGDGRRARGVVNFLLMAGWGFVVFRAAMRLAVELEKSVRILASDGMLRI